MIEELIRGNYDYNRITESEPLKKISHTFYDSIRKQLESEQPSAIVRYFLEGNPFTYDILSGAGIFVPRIDNFSDNTRFTNELRDRADLLEGKTSAFTQELSEILHQNPQLSIPLGVETPFKEAVTGYIRSLRTTNNPQQTFTFSSSDNSAIQSAFATINGSSRKTDPIMTQGHTGVIACARTYIPLFQRGQPFTVYTNGVRNSERSVEFIIKNRKGKQIRVTDVFLSSQLPGVLCNQTDFAQPREILTKLYEPELTQISETRDSLLPTLQPLFVGYLTASIIQNGLHSTDQSLEALQKKEAELRKNLHENEQSQVAYQGQKLLLAKMKSVHTN